MKKTTAKHSLRAFTLIELLAVIAIIGLLIGGVGLGLRGGNQNTALQGAQSIFASLLSSARGQAALKQQKAGIFVNMNAANTDRYLRHVVVAVDTSVAQDGSGWTPVDDGVMLPQGVYVVPRTSPAGFPSTLVSTALGASTVNLTMSSTTSEAYAYFTVSSLGTSSGGQIVLSTAIIKTDTGVPVLTFNNPNNVRGITISQYGIATLINESTGF